MMGDLRERDHLHDLHVDGKIILKCTFEQWGDMDWINEDEDRVQLAGACECGNELSGSIK
jgi:hypothetical protein